MRLAHIPEDAYLPRDKDTYSVLALIRHDQDATFSLIVRSVCFSSLFFVLWIFRDASIVLLDKGGYEFIFCGRRWWRGFLCYVRFDHRLLTSQADYTVPVPSIDSVVRCLISWRWHHLQTRFVLSFLHGSVQILQYFSMCFWPLQLFTINRTEEPPKR